MSEEQKFGLEGIEASQGYESMPVSNPVSNPDDIPTDGIWTESELARARRPATDDWGPEPIERDYVNNQTGEPTPSNQVVGERQAAADLAAVRAAEADARKQQDDHALAQALDQLNARDQGQPQQPAQDPQQPQPEFEPQPDGEADAARAEVDAAWQAADEQISEFLKNPHIRERIEGEFNQVRQQAHSIAEQARQHYAAAINNLAQEANIVASALFPELAGLSPEQVQGALRVMKPERVAQVREFANKIQGIANVAQQQAHGQQLANQQQFAAYQEQAAENFKRYAEQQDAKALAGETPESISAIRKTILADAKAAGVSEKKIYEAYNTVPALRHSFVQGLMADGAKWRASQRSLATHRRNPVPAVQRPGVSESGPRDDSDLSAAASRFNLPGGSEGTQGIRNAAAWLSAKRARG